MSSTIENPIEDPLKALQSIADRARLSLDSPEFAEHMDAEDSLRHFRAEFSIPKVSDVTEHPSKDALLRADEPAVYLCGNSLGLMPLRTQRMVAEDMEVWAKRGVQGHFNHDYGRPWASTEGRAAEIMATIVGAKPIEVAVMNTLTANLHSLLTSFYKPTKDRYKIIIEDKAFPSDHYAIESQIRLHNLDPSDAMILLRPRPNESTLRTADILSVLSTHDATTSILCLSGVQYYTGQLFDIPTLTAAAHSHGALAGWDLAHAAGNAPLSLHDWDVDFAAWCSYKYLNSGPGGIAALFVHERYANDTTVPRHAGWWGHDPMTRFKMDNVFQPIPGAKGWQVSNPSGLSLACVLGSLEIFAEAGMERLVEKSRLLTAYLEYLLGGLEGRGFEIITPREPNERGCQLSLRFGVETMITVWEALQDDGVVCDERKPDCIRIAPVPLYNSFADVRRFVEVLKGILARIC